MYIYVDPYWIALIGGVVAGSLLTVGVQLVWRSRCTRSP